MKIIISPAKKMSIDTDTLGFSGFPVFSGQAMRLMREIQGMTLSEAQALWGVQQPACRGEF